MKQTKFTSILRLLIYSGLVCILFSCKKFIDVGPPSNQLLTSSAFASDASAISAVSGIYSRMIDYQGQGFASGGLYSITCITALSSDELVSYASQDEFAANSIFPDNGILNYSLWSEPYRYIYSANLIIEGVEKYQGVTTTVKKQLQGEARFIRAFTYFYLVNMFGDVPFPLTTYYKTNASAKRTRISEVYNQIIKDLIDAQSLLSGDYAHSSGERIRPNKMAATAMLARVYLYNKQWEKAEIEATKVIDDPQYQLGENLNEVFLKNSKEAIWQLKPTNPGYNTNEGLCFRLTNSPVVTGSFSLNPTMIKAFELSDKRRLAWIDSVSVDNQKFYFPSKYKIKGGNGEPLSEYSMVLRLAEQYLIRAEARINLEDVEGSKKDLNEIRHRAGLTEYLSTEKHEINKAIIRERCAELFIEWGHRWFDLKRLNIADQFLSALKAPNWQPTDVLFPIPQAEILNNSNVKQNLGY